MDRTATARTEFESFVRSCSPALHRFALSLTGDRSSADDLVQDALVRLASNWDRVDQEQSPNGYVRQILVNLNLNRIRALQRELKFLEHARGEVSRDGILVEDDTRPLGQVWDDWLHSAFLDLSAKQRTAIALVHLWSYSINEAAEVMQCSRNTVKTHLERAMTALRAAAHKNQDLCQTRGTSNDRPER